MCRKALPVNIDKNKKNSRMVTQITCLLANRAGKVILCVRAFVYVKINLKRK